jgi:outer membrane protein assembly factor BamB
MEGEIAAYDLANSRAPLWSLSIGKDAVLYGRPVVDGEYVYIVNYAGVVYKLSADNSEAAKTVDLDSQAVGGVAVGLDTVYVSTSDPKTNQGILYALNADTLEIKWRYPVQGADALTDRIWGAPTVDATAADAGMVYFGCFDHYMYALDAVTGEFKWKFEVGGAIASKPLVYNGNVYFGAFDKKFYALDKTNGTEAWSDPYESGNWFWTEALVHDSTDNDIDDGTIYVGSLDHKVYALDANTGAWKSEFETDSPITSPVVIAGDKLIVAANSGNVYALDPENLANTQKWAAPFPLGEPIESPISVHGDFVYVYGRNSTLTARWLTTGGESGWEINTR